VTPTLGDYEIGALAAADAPFCEGMTFPAYRHLLALGPTERHPGEAEQRLVQPVGFVARVAGIPVALALAEVPVRREDGGPELLSLFVQTSHRRRGLAAALVAAIEDDLRARGYESLEATYTRGKPGIQAVERIFESRGWSAPELRTLTVRFTMEEALSTPWYGRVEVPEGARIFPWTELTPAERRHIEESNARAGWIPNGLRPWRHDCIGFEPVSSLGLRYRGEVVGWVINHRMDEGTVRFTCSFMRRDLSRRGVILALYTESIRRLSEAGCQYCTFVTPTVYPGMVQFITRHIAPYATFVGETRGTRKALVPASDQAAR